VRFDPACGLCREAVKGKYMGNGGFLPNKLEAMKFIVPALNKMFDPNGGLPQTKANVKILKQFYVHLGEHADHSAGADRRQRTLRHLGWLLTDTMFDVPATYPYPNDRLKHWLRYLTWVEHIAAKYKVTLNNQASNSTPAAVIKQTLLLSLKHDKQIVFDWTDATGGAYELTVDVMQNTDPMTINVASIKEGDIPTPPYSDDDDALDQQ
jgi:hypothetical protein